MREAIHAFILASAVRVVRGRKRNFSKHNSMLIHVSRFTNVIDRYVLLVTAEVDALRRSLETGSFAVVNSMKILWETDFVPTSEKIPAHYDIPEVTWDEVAAELFAGSLPVSNGMTIISGLSGVFSGFLKPVQRAAVDLGIDPRDILLELGRRKVVAGQEDLIFEVACGIAAGKAQAKPKV
jgi:hypothetical protein